MQAQSLTHARTHTSVAQESSGFEYAYTQFFTHLKRGKNSTEFKNQALICKVSAWLSRIGQFCVNDVRSKYLCLRAFTITEERHAVRCEQGFVYYLRRYLLYLRLY